MENNATLSIYDCNDNFSKSLSFNTILISLLLFFGIIGNGKVLFLYRFKMPQTEERFFIPYLAVADITSTIFLACLGISNNFYFADFPNQLLCKSLHYFSWVTTSWSAFILLMISISRYLKICRPTGKQMTIFGRKCAVYGCFIFAIINTSPVIYFVGDRHQNVSCLSKNVTVVMCELRDFDGLVHTLKMTYIFIEICVIFSNAGITAGLYVPIGLQIYRRFAKRSKRTTNCRLSVRKAVTLNDENSTPKIIRNIQCLISDTPDSKCEIESNCILGREDLNQQGVTTESEISSKTCNKIVQDVIETDIAQNIPQYHHERRNSSFEKNKLSQDTISDSNIQVRNNFTYMFLTIIIFYLL